MIFSHARNGLPSNRQPMLSVQSMQLFLKTPTFLFVLSTLSATVGCEATIAGADDAADATGGPGDVDGDGDGNGDNGGADGFEPCTADNPCPDGQFCFNGLCALGCTSDGDCADNQYCDTTSLLCQNNEVPVCMSDDDCADSQLCADGYCSTPPPNTSCDLENFLEDGCDTNALCLEQDDGSGACYSMPACASDGSCPVGIGGAVCNDGFLTSKGSICLLGFCTEEANCPDAFSCVLPTSGGGLGLCSSGVTGSPCTESDQCDSGTCNVIQGFVGLCS